MGTRLDPPPQEGWWGSLRLLLGLQQLGLLELGWQERCPQEGELGSQQQQDCKGEENVSVPCVKGNAEGMFSRQGELQCVTAGTDWRDPGESLL